MKVSPVFLANARANTRYVVNEGGTRSGKTYSILQTLINKHALTKRGQIIDIVRKTRREIVDTVLPDFLDITKAMGLYSDRNYHETKLNYTLNGNLFRFLGLDKAMKKRGSKRDILFVNEANGLDLEDWIQLTIRLSGQAYLDYNPSEDFWLDDAVLNQDPSRFTLIKSTYLDNYDFLPPSQITEIENLINIDDFYYQVYTLGKRASLKGKIFTKLHKITDAAYDDVFEDIKFYGLDFGFEHHTVLVEIKWAAEQCFERCLYMETHKTDDELIKWMVDNNVDYNATIYADPAYPASIQKLRDAGFTVRKAKKDVKDGIHFSQALRRNITDTSTEYFKQNDKYKYRQRGNDILEDPVKIKDDGPDAFRYAAYTELRDKFNPLGI